MNGAEVVARYVHREVGSRSKECQVSREQVVANVDFGRSIKLIKVFGEKSTQIIPAQIVGVYPFHSKNRDGADQVVVVEIECYEVEIGQSVWNSAIELVVGQIQDFEGEISKPIGNGGCD